MFNSWVMDDHETTSNNDEKQLILAIEVGDIEKIKLLLNQGQDPDYIKAAVYRAVIYYRIDILQILLDHGATVFMLDDYKSTTLHIAANYTRKGNDMMQFLLSKGVHINAQDVYGVTALHNAVLQNNIRPVEFLLTNGADIDTKDDNGNTALHLAVNKGCRRVIKFLLSQVKNVNITDQDDRTVLHLAARNEDIYTINAILDKEVEIDAQDCDNETALYIAVLHNNPNIVRILLRRGANIDIIYNNGYDIFYLANLESKDQAITRMLTSYRSWRTALPIRIIANRMKHITTRTTNEEIDYATGTFSILPYDILNEIAIILDRPQ